MNNKKILVLIILITTILVSAGCFGDEKPKPNEPKFEEATGSYPNEVGWLDSDMGDNQQQVDSSLILDINASEKVTLITISIGFDDYDSAHTESDDGSDPDEVAIYVTDGKNQSTPATGTTPCQLEVQLNSTDGSYMSGMWEVKVDALCGAGKPYTIIPRPGMISFLQYKDQGIAYNMMVSYSYLRRSS